MNPITNHAAVKAFALEVAAKRHHKFTRVSETFIDRIDSKVSTLIAAEIAALPSKGKTIT